MAKVTEINPKIITLEFRQERGDPDYGSCLWARFYLETKYTSKECSVIEQSERLVNDYPGEVWPWFISKDEMLYHLRNNGKYTDALVKAFLECNNMYDALTSAFGKNPNAQD